MRAVPSMTDLVAVFVDGDNLAASHADRIWGAAQNLGTVAVARVYGTQTALMNWSDAPTFQFVYAGCGKNASDVLMAVEVTEYVLSHPVQAVVLASSDSDFTHIARFVRARGHHVIGMGKEDTGEAMKSACSAFHALCPAIPAAARQTHLSKTDRKATGILREGGKTGIPMAQFGSLMYQRHNTPISATGHKTWRDYLSKRPSLYDLDPRGKDARVRLRPGAAS